MITEYCDKMMTTNVKAKLLLFARITRCLDLKNFKQQRLDLKSCQNNKIFIMKIHMNVFWLFLKVY